jgi:hypothetical protein
LYVVLGMNLSIVFSFHFAVTTGIFHAQYRVMESGCLFNIVLSKRPVIANSNFNFLTLPFLFYLVGLFGLFLLCLVLRQYFDGKREAWNYPVTTFPWFTAASKKFKLTTLPPPVLVKRGRSHSRSPQTEKPSPRIEKPSSRIEKPSSQIEKPSSQIEKHRRASSLGRERERKGHSRPSYPERTYGRPARHTKGRTPDGSYRSPDLASPIYDKYYRNASPRR